MRMSDRMDAKHMAARATAGLTAFSGRFRKEESGQGLVEYALVLLLVAMATNGGGRFPVAR